MLARLVFVLVAVYGLTISPVAAQVPMAQTDSRGIPTIAPLIDKVEESVVNISVVSKRPSRLTPLFPNPFFPPIPVPPQAEPEQRQVSAGSGVIVDGDEGYILTNNHVIESATEVRVVLRDNRSFEAELVGRDPATDMAVLRIDADGLTEIEIGDSEQLLVGDFVIAIGNPFGLGQTVTSGIVSALGRSGINPQGYEDFIQTDASINPGNSGGALITLDGKLVGINTAIISPNGGGNVGVGFAVPVNMAMAVMDQIIRFGEVQRGRLGVAIRDLTPDLAEALDIDITSGAVIVSVEAGTPADRADLAAGDVIVALDGNALDNSADLRQRIGLRRPGDTVEITYVRDGDRRSVMVDLAEGEGFRPQLGSSTIDEVFAGVRLVPVDRSHPAAGEVSGVGVVEVAPGSRAARAGLQAGDVITAVNRSPVGTIRDIERALGDDPRAVALSVWREGRLILLVLQR